MLRWRQTNGEKQLLSYRELWQALDEQIRGDWLKSRRLAREHEIRTTKDVIIPGDPDAHDEASVDPSIGARDTLLYLPHPYLTPGGQDAAFSEMYAWDTFFHQRGIANPWAP